MSELAYSLHLGSDKNRKNVSRAKAKSNASGTTSLSNNAIQNARQLSRVDKHNYRKYDDKQHLIEIVRGTTSLYSDVQKLYKDEFEEARLEYNSKQTRDDRKIDDYFYKISNDDKHDLACEIIIEIGNMAYWEDKSLEEKYKMTEVFENQLKDLKEIVPDFYIANATIHFDENSPHMHIVGVPVKENCKTGMERQVGKTSIFTKESLVVIQDKMRSKCIEEFNLTYSKDNKLKKKEKGKNRDYSAYERLKFNEKAEKLKQELNELREDVSELKDNKQKINEEIIDLNNDKENIKKEIDQKKKVNNKIIIKSKNQLWDENEKLKDEISDLQRKNYTLKNNYEDLEKRTNYLLKYLNKFLDKVPKIIKDIVNHLFIEKMYFPQFMQNYDPEQLEKNEQIRIQQEKNRKINLFNRNKNRDYKEELEKSNEDDFEL